MKNKLLILLFSLVNIFANLSIAKEDLIDILQITNHPALDSTTKGVIEELNNNGYKNIKVTSALGDIVIANQIAKKFISEKPLCVVAIATNSAQIIKAADKNNLTPIFFTTVTDPLRANLLQNLEKPEANITGVSNFINIDQQLEFFLKVLPNMKKIGMIFNSAEANSIKILAELNKALKKHQINLVTAVGANPVEVSAATAKLVANQVDAIFISNDNTALSSFKLIFKKAFKAKIPVLVSDSDLIQDGALASYGPNQHEIGIQTGKMIVKYLEGTPIAELPVEYPRSAMKIINGKIAAKLQINLANEILEEAEIK